MCLIKINTEENAALIRAARGRALVISFGPGWAAVNAVESPWTVPILDCLRDRAFEHGAGI